MSLVIINIRRISIMNCCSHLTFVIMPPYTRLVKRWLYEEVR